MRMSISDALLQAGFEVLASANRAEALETLAVRPDVLALTLICRAQSMDLSLHERFNIDGPTLGSSLSLARWNRRKHTAHMGSCSCQSHSRLRRYFASYEISRNAGQPTQRLPRSVSVLQEGRKLSAKV